LQRRATAPGEDHNMLIAPAQIPSRWQRRATAPGEDHNKRCLVPRGIQRFKQRRATAPGEDHNHKMAGSLRGVYQAAPGHRARRGSQQALEDRQQRQSAVQRRATAPGEDHNMSWS